MSNPISDRLSILIKKWNVATASRQDASVYIWKIQSDEQQMIDLFFQNETSTNKVTFDLFFAFDCPFLNIEEYNIALVDELKNQLSAYQEAFSDEPMPTTWQPAPPPEYDIDEVYFIENFNTFLESLTDLEDNLVLYLSPQKVTSFSKWDLWLNNVLEKSHNPRLKFMLIEPLEDIWFPMLYQKFPDATLPILAELDMPGAMQEVAAGVNPSLPGAQFQKFFLKLANFIGKGKIEKAALVGQDALQLARKEGWQDLRVAVLMQLGNGWFQQGDISRSIAHYERADIIADSLHKKGDKSGTKLLIQVRFGKGSVYISTSDYNQAIQCYQGIVPLATAIKDHFSLMETYRMSAYCYECTKDYEQAWECNQLALTTSQSLEEKLRQNSTLPYVGQALLRLNVRLGDKDTENTIRQQMIALAGNNWEAKLS